MRSVCIIQYGSQGQNLANTVSRALSITNEVDSVSCSIKHLTLYNAPPLAHLLYLSRLSPLTHSHYKYCYPNQMWHTLKYCNRYIRP